MGHRGRKSIAELHAISVARNVSAARSAATEVPQAPSHLSAETRAWWGMVLRDHELDTHQLRSLQVICEAWDRKEEARKALKQHGLVYQDDKGMFRPRPETQIERNSMIMFLRGIRELGLKVEPPANSGLQPAALYR
jgi:P27 family predicted phage terminase small subunit